MVTVAEIEQQIREVEKFRVYLVHSGSKRRLHSNLQGLAEYPYKTPAPSNMSANRWCRLRFNPTYPDHCARVILANGNEVRGPERLYAIRRSYT